MFDHEEYSESVNNLISIIVSDDDKIDNKFDQMGKQEIIKQFNIYSRYLDNCNILFSAHSEYDSKKSVVVFEINNKIYKIVGYSCLCVGHCQCQQDWTMSSTIEETCREELKEECSDLEEYEDLYKEFLESLN